MHRYLLEVGGVGTVVFVGHFLRDLSAFPALDRLRTWGIPALKVGVGTSIPYPDSEADLWLKDLKDVPLLLEELYSLTGRYGTA